MLLSHIQNVICGVLCSYKFSVLRLSTYMQSCPISFEYVLFTASSVCGWLACKTDPKLPNKKKPRDDRSIDEAGHSTFVKISSGMAKLFVWPWIELRLRTCRETVCNHESEEQFTILWSLCLVSCSTKYQILLMLMGGKKAVPHHYIVTHSVFFRLHLFLRLSDVPKFYNSYGQTAELNTCMVQDPVGVFWDVVLCSLVVYGETCSIRILLEVGGFLEVLVPCYVATLRT